MIMKRLWTTLLAGMFLGSAVTIARAEFLFAPTNPSDNGFFWPTMSLVPGEFEYSAWDVFYAPHTQGNYPDVFAPYGGVQVGGLDTPDDYSDDLWAPEPRSQAGFPASGVYNPGDPYAFWDLRNATIKQVQSNTTFIIGPDASGNIYTFQDKTAYQLHNAPVYNDGLGTVLFQFQTDGTNVDFANIRLGYMGLDGNVHYLGVNDQQTEYLREYSTTGSDHWSATAGYRNRLLFQWDLSGVSGTGEYWIEWASQSSSMSFQKADLMTASYYEIGMPVSSTWGGGSGTWSDASNWTGQTGSVPLENGNLKFKNLTVAELEIDDANHLVGEIIFDNASDVTISSANGHGLTANTGITTRSTQPDAASRVYTINTDYAFGALNFFEINTGKVVMNGDISGNYGMVKLGAGTLELNGDNSFTGFLAVQDGTVRIGGTNSYTGTTTVVNGRLIVANNGALGNATTPIVLGGDAGLYAYTTGASAWSGELWIEGDHEISRNLALAPGDLGKRIGAMGTTAGAVYSGAVSFSGNPADPDADAGASNSGNVRITAQGATDRVSFTGAMSGGAATKTVTLDGQGTVVYSGVDKTYGNSTIVSSGSLLIVNGTSLAGSGNVTVASGARVQVDGGLTTSGQITLNGGTLRVDGTVGAGGAFNFNGGTVTGGGTINRVLVIDNGDVIAPGNSTGTLNTVAQTWGGGGSYLWEIASVDAGAGTGWDLLNITGALNVTASGASPFEIRITSLGIDQLPGLLAGFDQFANYSWRIASTSAGIAGFDESLFALNTGDFANVYSGEFGLSVSGGDLYLNYTAVPEPGTWGLLAVAAVILWRWRRSSFTSSPQRGEGLLS